jgi:hypothetical protein
MYMLDDTSFRFNSDGMGAESSILLAAFKRSVVI